MDTPRFGHDPYDLAKDWKEQLRLLEMLPDLSPARLIRCRMTTVKILPYASENIEYTCLSYTWGDPPSSEHPILVNDRLLYVHTNLWHFLDVARSKYTDRRLWIDALCINQNDDQEKSALVAVMGPIYSEAKEVIVWLGRNRQLGSFLGFWATLSSQELETTEEMAQVWQKHRREVERGCRQFFTNPYWRRAWITQEITLAKNIKLLAHMVEVEPSEMPFTRRFISYLYGQTTLAHADAISIVGPTKQHRTLLEYYLGVMFGIKNHANMTLFDMFRFLPGRLCSEPRDLVYSLRYITTDGPLVPVEYEAPDTKFILDFIRVSKTSTCLCSLVYVSHLLKWPEDARDEPSGASRSIFHMKAYPHGVKGRKGHWRCKHCDQVLHLEPGLLLPNYSHMVCLSQTCICFHGHLFLITDNQDRRHLIATSGVHYNRATRIEPTLFRFEVTTGQDLENAPDGSVELLVRIEDLCGVLSRVLRGGGSDLSFSEMCMKARTQLGDSFVTDDENRSLHRDSNRDAGDLIAFQQRTEH